MTTSSMSFSTSMRSVENPSVIPYFSLEQAFIYARYTRYTGDNEMAKMRVKGVRCSVCKKIINGIAYYRSNKFGAYYIAHPECHEKACERVAKTLRERVKKSDKGSRGEKLMYVCRICGKKISSEDKARNHIWFHIFKPSTICELGEVSSIAMPPYPWVKPYRWVRCKLCGNIFTEAVSLKDPRFKKSLEKHILAHHNWWDFYLIAEDNL